MGAHLRFGVDDGAGAGSEGEVDRGGDVAVGEQGEAVEGVLPVDRLDELLEVPEDRGDLAGPQLGPEAVGGLVDEVLDDDRVLLVGGRGAVRGRENGDGRVVAVVLELPEGLSAEHGSSLLGSRSVGRGGLAGGRQTGLRCGHPHCGFTELRSHKRSPYHLTSLSYRTMPAETM
jgi:hypothetical protein